MEDLIYDILNNSHSQRKCSCLVFSLGNDTSTKTRLYMCFTKWITLCKYLKKTPWFPHCMLDATYFLNILFFVILLEQHFLFTISSSLWLSTLTQGSLHFFIVYIFMLYNTFSVYMSHKVTWFFAILQKSYNMTWKRFLFSTTLLAVLK